MVELIVENFIRATNELNFTHLQHFSRAMLHGIHSSYPPLEVKKSGEDIVSKKKLDKGDGIRYFTKEIIGWNYDGKTEKQLPEDKYMKIIKLIKRFR